MTAATQRVVVLMPPEDKARLEEKARRAGTSIGEIVRRSVDAYEPELEGAELEALLRLLEESHARAMRSLDEAEKELAVTRAYFDAKRKREVDGHRR
ncbi:MAG: ribbon-helix-helix protein, CopG family [Geminicoccaceae bacterium]